MNLRIPLRPAQGYNKIFDVGEYGMKLTRFGLLTLAANAAYDGNTGESELALVLLGGTFAAAGDGWSFEVRDGDIERIETKDEAFLHEDLAVYTKHRGRVLMRVNRQAADKLRSMADRQK